MTEAMDKLIEKISGYELLNNLIPGAVYIGVVDEAKFDDFESSC